MSGIFKGDSIYKSGGGGGGYKNGGELTPAEYITVPNNVIAEYENNAAEINFIIENDGNPHNSIIQVSTTVNATVNVYELRNGFYYLLGVVGSNTLNAGDDYTVNIIGGSYVVENVTQQSSDPEAAEIAGEVVPVLKVNNLLWACADLGETEYNNIKIGGVCYYDLNLDININGWRIPTQSEVVSLNNAYTWQQLRAVSSWPSGYNGNNASGFNAFANGCYRGGAVSNKNWSHYMMYKQTSPTVKPNACFMEATSTYAFSVNAACTVRLVYDL